MCWRVTDCLVDHLRATRLHLNPSGQLRNVSLHPPKVIVFATDWLRLLFFTSDHIMGTIPIPTDPFVT